MVRLARIIMGIVLAWVYVASPTTAQQGDELHALDAQFNKLYAEGKYAEAIPLAERALAIQEKALGPGHRSVAILLNNLAQPYDMQAGASWPRPAVPVLP